MIYSIKPEKIIIQRKGVKTITRIVPDHVKTISKIRRMAKKNNDQITRISYEKDYSLTIEVTSKLKS